MEKVKKLQDILGIYPNLMNNDLPHSVDCTSSSSQSGEPEHRDEPNSHLPFIRILPKPFKIKSVTFSKRPYGCICAVEYVLADGKNLPADGLQLPIACLTKYFPQNTEILEKQVKLVDGRPKIVEVFYVICCRCSRPNVQHIESGVTQLKISGKQPR